jgi:Protein of unknown function (DUF2442)
MVKARVITTDAEIDAALARGQAEPERTLGVSARYVPIEDIFIVELTDGTRLVLPREKLQGLENATPTQLANIEVLTPGTILHWEDLAVDLYIPALIEGVYGTKRWMSELGRSGGIVKSQAKRNAARTNGLKGGRPKKQLVSR